MNAVLYVRVSTTEQAQEGYSIPAQTSILRDFAKAYGYTITKIYQDAGISGKNIKDRPAMCELIEDAKQNNFDVVLVWKLSRLSRSLLDLLSIVDLFNKHNISFQSYTEKFDTSTPMGKMLLQMLGSIAEFERNTIAENVKMGLAERFKQGYSKGAIPFGYKSENKQAVIVPEQAEIIRYIYNTYLNSDGECLTYLAEKLNSEGFRTRTGGLWSRTSIRDLLKNNFYAGYVRTGIHSHGYKINQNAEIAKGSHDPIISDDVFNQVNAKITAMKKNNIVRCPDNESVLTGLVVCPRCGFKMFALNTYNRYIAKDGTERRYTIRIYRCNNHDKGKGACKGFYISANKVEPTVISLLSDYIDNRKYLNQTPHEKPIINLELKRIDMELKQAIKVKERYFALFESGKVDINLFSDKINDVLEKINILEKQKTQISKISTEKIDYNNQYGKIKELSFVYDNLSNKEKKDFIRGLVKEVNISTEKRVTNIVLTNGHNLLS